jgi:exonuclease III
MKMISWNVRGLGGAEKRREVKRMVVEKSPYILCLQETKLPVCDYFLCNSLWGDSNYNYSFRPSVGASGGLLIIWDSTEVEVWSSGSQEHVLHIHGRLIRSNEEFYMFNIYAPCEPRAKQELWVSVTARLEGLRGAKVCVCGDFNAVRTVEERWSSRGNSSFLDIQHFSRFIDDNGLVDLPLCGRRYTWFKGDGSAMSRLDRFLLSEEWCLQWPNSFQVALLRGFVRSLPASVVCG